MVSLASLVATAYLLLFGLADEHVASKQFLLAEGSSPQKTSDLTAPPAPTLQFYVVVFRPAGRPLVWDEGKSRSFLKGFWLWNENSPDDVLNKAALTAPDRDLSARLKSFKAEGENGRVVFFVSGEKLSSIDLYFQENGKPSGEDIYTLDMCDICETSLTDDPTMKGKPGFAYSMGGFPQVDLISLILHYIHADVETIEERQAGKIDRAGQFLLHVVDSQKRDFLLPFVTASWHLEWRPHIVARTIKIQPAL